MPSSTHPQMQPATRTLVLYKTKYGSTRQYAQWIAESLGGDLRSVDEVRAEELRPYGTVVIGGSIRMGRITCADVLQTFWPNLSGKHVILFSVSGTKPEDPEVQACFQKSIPASIRAAIAFFPLWGRIGALDWKDRILMLFPRYQLRRRLRLEPLNEELRKKYEEISHPFDHVDRAAIEPIVRCASGM